MRRLILRLYPWDFRALFAEEMLRTFDDEHPVHELLGLLAGAANEWIAKLTTDPAVRGRALPDLRMMRPVGVTKELWFRSH